MPVTINLHGVTSITAEVGRSGPVSWVDLYFQFGGFQTRGCIGLFAHDDESRATLERIAAAINAAAEKPAPGMEPREIVFSETPKLTVAAE